MQIGQLAKKSGISIRMLRYYEHQGLIVPMRSESGYRIYNAKDEERLRRIRILTKAGLTLQAISLLLPCISVEQLDVDPCEQVIDSLKNELDNINKKIENLQISQQYLSDYLNILQQKKSMLT
ncbi:MerR family transcriptional regulator [Acinetobacter cumulans]|jgi:DNA-binding transcriptional MerR regulator|uniref:MerR family transcriptional regulator n=1 Tax=Acinetobacter cumulans TaxID=2136182 RepID=A0A498CYT7_9GAMM|nr:MULTISPECIES: MerR family transcriptional regulator [Acinetobacter]NWK74852.1 MerR family transcriptional regulator [Acinetobacter sp. SwsAc6]QCO21566.1 MerR family transcriptional regulator [Acinetobacter cumulans]RFS27825.1 MerR family transcriptional regulator [Acinetobacter sp. SWAC5]RKG42187.1 MerR family transcriptional regulator [Acinetobacter cumulans]RLL33809.1 MerR family transcriptional regulator [Acinetobacter cumulans]